MPDSRGSTDTVILLSRADWCAWIAHVPAPAHEIGAKRRAVRRALTHGPVELRYTAEGHPSRQLGWIMEVSDAGLMVRCPQPVPAQTPVEVTWEDANARFGVRGVIIHCTETVGGFKLGVQLQLPETAG